jgi:hypothetical protein
MKFCLHKLEITNFTNFRELAFNLKDRHRVSADIRFVG